jgi:CMP-N,N'-diacetyllegionaminic acid synthase
MAKVLALIPARGGSKGVPGKNIRTIAGKPLIAHSIIQAQESKIVDQVIVSSDDVTILKIASDYEANVLRRPKAMAQDESPVIDAIAHAFENFGPCDVVVLLQPTSPLRTSEDIDTAVQLFMRTKRPVCSVYRVEDTHPARMYHIKHSEHGEVLNAINPNLAEVRRQDLPPVYLRNGAIYVFGPEQIKSRSIITNNMMAYIMPSESSINVDTEMDFNLLKLMMEQESFYD